jgi:hypothetical protein
MTHGMPHPEFTVLLARQRSGTNALLSILATHAEIFCFDEVFRRDELIRPDPVQRRGNYFAFLEEYGRDDITRIFPDRHEQLLDDYLAHLRRLTDKRLIVIDVKYNSTHHISGMWRPMAEPSLFRFLTARGVAVLHLTRRNYLRCLLSHLKAWESQRYYVFEGTAPPDVRIPVPAAWALSEMQRWRGEDAAVAAAFEGYERYRQIEYSQVFPDTSGSIAPAALSELRGWFGIADGFVNQAALVKQSSLPLAATVDNFDELRDVLRGTCFEYCLQDEPAYQTVR